MPFTEDLRQFLQTQDFATAAVYSGTGASVNGILDSEYTEPFHQAQSAAPFFVCRTADVPNALQGETLTIGATVYTIRGVEPDGLGLTVLRLRK